jgi:hypothetical protein
MSTFICCNGLPGSPPAPATAPGVGEWELAEDAGDQPPMGSPPVAAAAAAAASWRGWLGVKCTVFGMMAVNCEGFKLLTLQFLDFKIVRILYLHMLCSDNFIFRCCTATIFSSDVVQLNNNFLRCAATQQSLQMCSYTTISSDMQLHNNLFRCCAATVSSDVVQHNKFQFLQLCSNNNSFRCAKLNISEEILELKEGDKRTNTQKQKTTLLQTKTKKQHFFKTKTKNNTSSKQKTTQLYSISSQNRTPFGTYILLITQSFWTICFDGLCWNLGIVFEDDATTTTTNCLPTNQASGKSWAT